jgi:site-specific DNA-methyltransferase (adenine-specific)
MKKIDDKSVQLCLTSPPYSRGQRIDGLNNIYSSADTSYDDNLTDDEYINWMTDVFKEYERILKDRGVVAFNFSYTKYSPSLPYFLINSIFKNTNFLIADTVAWEKSSAIPISGHPNRLTRKCEFVYIFVKKDHLNDFEANKEIKSVSRTGQRFFKIYYNILKAKNNDGKTEGHGATFSSDFAKFFIDLYSFPDSIVLDNFMGTGTVAVSAIDLGRNWIGIDLSRNYCNIAEKRIKEKIGDK